MARPGEIDSYGADNELVWRVTYAIDTPHKITVRGYPVQEFQGHIFDLVVLVHTYRDESCLSSDCLIGRT